MQKLRSRLFRSKFRWGMLLFCITMLGYWLWVPADISDQACGLESNSAWISVDWTSQPVDEAEVRRLSDHASARKLRDLYPFVTYVKADGSFSPSYDHATEFVTKFRQFNDETRLLAWVGMPLQWIDLADQTTRQEIITFVVELVETAQFDGVHINAEVTRNNDTDYLIFLEELRQALGQQYIISIAGSHWIPTWLDRLPWFNDNRLRWNSDYYQAVAEQVDQIAVMTYDSFHTYPAIYRLWLREQTRGLDRQLSASKVELLIGISISREHTLSHDPTSENMEHGLAGICAGVLVSSQNMAQGVAIYASWEAEPADWQIWEAWIRTKL